MPCQSTPEMTRCYDEAVEVLPTGHHAYDDTCELGPAPSRASLGLPEDALVLCGFNHAYKIEPVTFDAWCTVLSHVPRPCCGSTELIRSRQASWPRRPSGEASPPND